YGSIHVHPWFRRADIGLSLARKTLRGNIDAHFSAPCIQQTPQHGAGLPVANRYAIDARDWKEAKRRACKPRFVGIHHTVNLKIPFHERYAKPLGKLDR